MNAALLFPGQGAQTPGFLHRLPSDAAVRMTLEEASAVLGIDVLSLDTAAALRSTVAVQITLAVAGVAVARALEQLGMQFDAAAGLSVGAFGAAVTCGALSFADALPLVKLRGELMQQAYPHGYGMAALVGLDERAVEALVATAGGAAAEIYIANVNAPTQIVVAGADASLEAVMRGARQIGARQAERMQVGVPSHCALLDGVADELAAAMSAIDIHRPVQPYVSNRRARVIHDAAGVRDDLSYNAANTVRWHDSMTVLHESGVRLFIEMPPGQVLTRLAQQSFDDVRAVAAEDSPLATVITLAGRSRHLS